MRRGSRIGADTVKATEIKLLTSVCAFATYQQDSALQTASEERNAQGKSKIRRVLESSGLSLLEDLSQISNTMSYSAGFW